MISNLPQQAGAWPPSRSAVPAWARWLATAALLWAVCGPAAAIAAPPPEELGASDYARRQRVMHQLWRDRDATRQQVEHAARHGDPEIAARARWILDRWRQGLLPETPPEVLRQISGSDGIARLEGLLDAGLLEGVIVAVEQSLGAADGPQLRAEVSELIERRFPFYVRTAVQTDQLETWLRLLDIATESPALSVARAQLIQRLGLDLQQRGLLPPSAQRWPPEQRTRTEVMVLTTLGRWDQALALADGPGMHDLRRACWMLSGRWDALARHAQQAALAAAPQSDEAYAQWSDCLIAATRANDAALRQQAAEQLMATTDRPLPAEVLALRWRSLMINGYVDPAVQILSDASPADAGEVLLALGRPHDALRQLGVDPHDREPGLQRLLDEAAAAQQKLTASDPFGDHTNPSLDRLLAAGRLLIATGSAGRARELFGQAAQLQDGTGQTHPARLQVVRALVWAARPEWAIELAAGPGEQTISNNILFDLGLRLAERDVQAFATVWQGLLAIRPRLQATDRLRLAAELFDGRVPAGFDAQSDLDQLYQQFFSGGRAIRSVNGRAVLAGAGSFTAGLGDFFLALGRQDLARRIYLQIAATGDAEGDLRLASLELAGGRADQALALYRDLWARSSGHADVSRPALAVLRISRSTQETTAALKAAVGEAICLHRMGQTDAADAQWELLQSMLCTPSAVVRQQLAEHLSESGLPQRALDELEPLMRYTALGIDEALEMYQVSQLYVELTAATQPGRAAECSDLAVAGTLESTAYFPRAYVLLPARSHALAALDASQQNDGERLRRHLDAALQLQPVNIDLAEDLLPQLRQAGYADEADRVLQAVIDSGMQYLERFPLDANTTNNLAWVMALADAHLDDALRLALRATYLQPDSVSYRDTLAEVLYRNGRRDEALLIERHCLLDEAGEWHVHEQIERFTDRRP